MGRVSWRLLGGIGFALPLLLGGCASSGVREACLKVRADDDLAFYDGQPHVTVLHIWPLSDPLGFEQTTEEGLLSLLSDDKRARGQAGERRELPVKPGSRFTRRLSFPGETTTLGLLADFYQAPGVEAGRRKDMVEADCGWLFGWFGVPKLHLTRHDLLVE